jgi:PAS domain S-box-containing protein
MTLPPVAADVGNSLRAERSFRAQLEAMPNLVFLHRGDALVYVNPAALGALGLANCAEVVGRSFRDFLHPEDRNALETSDGSAQEAACEPSRARRLRLLRSDGTVRMIERFSIPILFEGALTTASIATDVTESDQATEKLMLADRLAAIGTLAAGAAHELNNPLTYATLNVDHVLRQLRIAAAQERSFGDAADIGEQLAPLVDSLLEAQQGMMRIRDIVRNLMTFSQGTVESRTLVDVRSVVEASIQMALHEIVHRACLLRDLGPVPPVEANEARLGQVFLNLIANAAQAIPEGDARAHQVRVATHTDDAGNAVIEVGDTGVGIAPDGVGKVFDPFFTSKAPGEGVGLGLSMSLGTIKSLGGDIEVASVPERGTVFRVRLPPAKGWRSTHCDPVTEAEGVERTRVLVVDDDPHVCEALERSLSGLADVEAMTDARSVLDRLRSGERWAVILCDLLMPGTSGMDLYRDALQVAPEAAACFVFMSAGAFTPKSRAFLEAVHNPCLEKPLDMGRLRSLIARVGSRRSEGARS